MKIPGEFARRIESTFGERGGLFLRALPGLMDEAARRWQLKQLQPAEQLSYHFIVHAKRDGAEVVLKLGVPERELTSEIHALRHFAGRGTARLLESDPGRGMLLLERLTPGVQLATLADDAEATQIAAELMLQFLRPAPADNDLLQLSDWFQGLTRFRASHKGGTGPLDAGVFKQAEAVGREMLEEESRPTLMHGDLHHFNILSSGARWAAIDPKGVIGPAAYEVGPLLINPRERIKAAGDLRGLMQRRIAILADVLGIQRERIRRYGLAHAVLSAVWSIEEKGDWREAMECGQALADITL